MEPVPGANTSIVAFEGQQNITVLNAGGAFLFLAREVGVALGYAQAGRGFVVKVTGSWAMSDGKHFQRQYIDSVYSHDDGKAPIWLTEPGLYRALMRSRAPKAEAFQEWLATEVLPALRRDGRYAVPGATPTPPPPATTAAQLRALVAELRGESDPLLRALLIRAAELELGEDLRGLASPATRPPPATPARLPNRRGPVVHAPSPAALEATGHVDPMLKRAAEVANDLFDAVRHDRGRFELLEQVVQARTPLALRLVAMALRAARLPPAVAARLEEQVGSLIDELASPAMLAAG